MKFVTAIYSKLFGTEFGGRLNRDRHYLYSLRSLLTMDAEFVCYTSSEEYDWLAEEFKDFSNLELRKFELSNYLHHGIIQTIKEENKELYAQDDVWMYRCVELMWLKMDWLYQESQAYDGKVFWLDSGLSHGGIIPIKYNRHYGLTVSYEESFENVHAFDSRFLNKLDAWSDKFFAFYCTNRQHQHRALFMNDENNLGGSIVAGLIGGQKDYVKLVHDEVQIVVERILEARDLIQEEMALTVVYRDHPDYFNVYEFGTWYHMDWDCFDPSMKSFSAFFENLDEWIR